MTHEHLLVVQKHAVDRLDGTIGGLGSLVVHETVSLGVAMLVRRDLAREDVAEGCERVVQSLDCSWLIVLRDNSGKKKDLVVDLLVQVLNENVARPRLAQRGVALGPHDAAVAWSKSVSRSRTQIGARTRHGF